MKKFKTTAELMSHIESLPQPTGETPLEKERAMSDTPETTEETRRKWNADGTCDYVVDADFASKLERERNEARRITERLRKCATPDLVLPWENTNVDAQIPAPTKPESITD